MIVCLKICSQTQQRVSNSLLRSNQTYFLLSVSPCFGIIHLYGWLPGRSCASAPSGLPWLPIATHQSDSVCSVLPPHLSNPAGTYPVPE